MREPTGLLPGELVATPSGMVQMRALEAGDQVIGGNGYACTVLGVWQNEPSEIYEVRTVDGARLKCAAGHHWRSRSPSHMKMGLPSWLVASTDMLAKHSGEPGNQWAIPLTPVIQFEPARKIEFDPYLLACRMGGADVQLGRNERILLEYVHGWIPRAVLYGRRVHRLAFLRALCDMHGTLTQDKKTVQLRLSSKTKAAEICQLVRSLGMHCDTRSDGRANHVALIRSPFASPFREHSHWRPYTVDRRYVSYCKPAGKAVTVAINVDSPDNTFVAGTGLLVTHNAQPW